MAYQPVHQRWASVYIGIHSIITIIILNDYETSSLVLGNGFLYIAPEFSSQKFWKKSKKEI